jgi:hypothetical protein
MQRQLKDAIGSLQCRGYAAFSFDSGIEHIETHLVGDM